MPTAVVTLLVAGDKLIGGLAKDAFGMIQNLALPFMAVSVMDRGADSHWAVGLLGSWMVLSVDMAGSIAETIKELSGSIIKWALLNEHRWAGLVCCLQLLGTLV